MSNETRTPAQQRRHAEDAIDHWINVVIRRHGMDPEDVLSLCERAIEMAVEMNKEASGER